MNINQFMGEDKYKYSNNFKLPPPPGSRFYPSDEELLHFLSRNTTATAASNVIPHLHLYSYHPWQLNGKALREGNQWYLYSKKRRAHEKCKCCNGHWEALDIIKELHPRSQEILCVSPWSGHHLNHLDHARVYSLLPHSSSPSPNPILVNGFSVEFMSKNGRTWMRGQLNSHSWTNFSYPWTILTK